VISLAVAALARLICVHYFIEASKVINLETAENRDELLLICAALNVNL